MALHGLGAVYPKIGGAGTVTSVSRLDLGDIAAAALTTPTATKATVTAVTAGMGYLAVTIDGSSFNLMTCLDA